ncbi:helix-turn-helix domain-containing protein [Natronomonas halophila]|uniref:helix-turn-helix domain-containing protein n=1 Tax=Natronomonas halophila TaxID=2747817 RepID=UPI0015B60BE7|nr:helix-turn-helix domain-containing protein [Natronomonas halophila]QLD85670.1 helix-turn-helix domain-containing protein [Natronomonas halophila]
MGLEAAVTVNRPRDCPVATASAATDATVGEVARSSVADGTVVEEFEVAGEGDPPTDAREVFEDDRYTVYRFERDADRACPCERIETFGCPVADISAVDGRLRVVFRPEDVETLRDVVASLRERYAEVNLEHLVRSGASTAGETVVVDRGRLTDRQREVIETAYEMGYFDHPKGANAAEVAAALDISSATFRGHLAAAQSKLLDEVLDG